jgi:hypothetical protein
MEIGAYDFSFVTILIPLRKGDAVYFNVNCLDSDDKNTKNMHINFYDADKWIVSSTAR